MDRFLDAAKITLNLHYAIIFDERVKSNPSFSPGKKKEPPSILIPQAAHIYPKAIQPGFIVGRNNGEPERTG